MRIVKWVLIAVSALLVITIAVIGYLYVSFNNSNPRDLGVTYTQEDWESARSKSQIVYEELPAGLPDEEIWQTFGERDITTTWTNAEITAIVNNKPGIWNPYSNLQVKFNADGSGEISGNLDRSKLERYAATFDAPKEAVDIGMRFLPENTAFYAKGRASMKDNNIVIFEPMKFEIGRVNIPLGPILANSPLEFQIVPKAYAMDITGLISEISSVSNKEALIIDFINSRLQNIEGFYAKEAYFAEDQLYFDGTLPEREATVR